MLGLELEIGRGMVCVCVFSLGSEMAGAQRQRGWRNGEVQEVAVRGRYLCVSSHGVREIGMLEAPNARMSTDRPTVQRRKRLSRPHASLA